MFISVGNVDLWYQAPGQTVLEWKHEEDKRVQSWEKYKKVISSIIVWISCKEINFAHIHDPGEFPLLLQFCLLIHALCVNYN